MPGIGIDSHLKKVKSGSSVGPGTGPQPTVYRPQVIYSYEVQGRRFEGKRLRFGSEPHTTVHYDPAKPSESVLEPRVAGFWNRRLVFSVALLATGAVLWSLSVALN